MPYVTPERRKALEKYTELPAKTYTVGDLSYLLSQQLRQYLKTNPVSYTTYNHAGAALLLVADPKLALALIQPGKPPPLTGILNLGYHLAKLVVDFAQAFKLQGLTNLEIYAEIRMVIDYLLHDLKTNLIEPYENTKKQANGDVWL